MSRRHLLKVGGAGLLGLTLPKLLWALELDVVDRERLLRQTAIQLDLAETVASIDRRNAAIRPAREP